MEVTNTIMIWSIGLLVQYQYHSWFHGLVLSNRPLVSMTNLLDADVRRYKLVSCFSKLNPPAHGPFTWIDLLVARAAGVND